MQLSPYLLFNGECEAAFKFYEQVLGGKITVMMTWGEAPAAEQFPAEWHNSIMHATLALGDAVLMGTDAPPDHYKQPQGMNVSLHLKDIDEGNASLTRWQQAVACRCHFRRPSGRPASACALIDSAHRG